MLMRRLDFYIQYLYHKYFHRMILAHHLKAQERYNLRTDYPLNHLDIDIVARDSIQNKWRYGRMILGKDQYIFVRYTLCRMDNRYL